jgi:hypothetical protein
MTTQKATTAGIESLEQITVHAIPPDILAAANKVSRWFSARGINVWALAADQLDTVPVLEWPELPR